MKTRKIINHLLTPIGYQVRPTKRLGVDPRRDLEKLIPTDSSIVVFDVGANVGKTATAFRRQFPQCAIHAFEPDPSVYAKLEQRLRGMPRVETNNLALGNACGSQTFRVYTDSVMNSFLEPGEPCSAEVKEEVTVEVTTLDAYCKTRGVEFVHLLKTDTQGYELEVFKGAGGMMAENRIQVILVEVIFSEMYRQQARFPELITYLVDNNFSLVAFYDIHEYGGVASWADALFVNLDFAGNR